MMNLMYKEQKLIIDALLLSKRQIASTVFQEMYAFAQFMQTDYRRAVLRRIVMTCVVKRPIHGSRSCDKKLGDYTATV